MQIHGLIKTTLLDYPDHLACTVFLGGCNFRCPFCHNKGLVLFPETQNIISEEYLLEYLNKRRNILEGVCITGGEPTIHKDLKPFISSLKELGFKIKLDTNGYRPDVIKDLYAEGLIDYIAMDVKATKSKYPLVTDIPNLDLSKIQESIDFILSTVKNYEFRTTVVKEFHTFEDIGQIKEWLGGCKLYRLQTYRDSENVISSGFSAYSEEEFKLLEAQNGFSI